MKNTNISKIERVGKSNIFNVTAQTGTYQIVRNAANLWSVNKLDGFLIGLGIRSYRRQSCEINKKSAVRWIENEGFGRI